MKAFDIEVCPDKATFSEDMNKMKADGQLINWQAICLDRGAKNEEINYVK